MLLASSLLNRIQSSLISASTRRLLTNCSFNLNKTIKTCSLQTNHLNQLRKHSLLSLPSFLTLTTTTFRQMSTTNSLKKLSHVYENIIRSSQDKRVYRAISLDNGIKCLLVSDPQTDRSAASLDVNAGYLLDPAEFPGLAHFCEHMLFMGSKKVYLFYFLFFAKIL